MAKYRIKLSQEAVSELTSVIKKGSYNIRHNLIERRVCY